MTEPEKHLATYGDWNPAAFFSLASDENRTVMIIAARSVAVASDNTRLGLVVRRIWNGIIATVPSIVGHRLMWSELLFFAPTAIVQDVVRAIVTVTSSSDTDVHVRAAIQIAPHDPAARAKFCDELAAGLTKIEYRKSYPDAWCIFDGVVVHAPS